MPEYPWQPGMRITASRMRVASRIGAIIFRADRVATWSIPSGDASAAGAIPWDEISLDSMGGVTPGQPTRWTCTVRGWYMLVGGVGFNGNANGSVREVCWAVNGSIPVAGRARRAYASGTTYQTVEARTYSRLCEAGDYIELWAGQNSGADLPAATSTPRSYMTITYAGPA